MAGIDGDVVCESLQGLFADPNGAKRLLEYLLEQAMKVEVAEHLAADRHQRTEGRRGYRNGHKPRTLLTRVGQLQLEVPQVRACEPYHPSMFAKWQRSERALLVACAEMYFRGVSTRNVQQVLEAMCEGDISSMTVSRVAAELDETLEVFRRRRLDAAEYRYLLVDARYEKVRVEQHVVSQAALVVAGVNQEGKREILDWRMADSESEATWGEVFEDLKARGIQGVRLVVSDAHQGIVSAMRRQFQGVPWQRCQVHFKRELGRKVSYKKFKELMAAIGAVFQPEDRAECLRRGEEMARQWEGRYPAVAKMIRDGLEDCLTALGFPEHHRCRLRSTNMLENVMKRLKKRSSVIGVFANRSSCERLLGSQLIEIHEEWSLAKTPYCNMENIE